MAVAVAVVVALAGAGGVWGVARWRQRSRPSVILIVVDSLRPDRLSSYGYARPTSPNIDRLATRGVRFSSAHSTSSWTLPAVASLFTGLYPETHGVRYALSYGRRIVSQQELPGEYEVLAERFKSAGYRTYGVSSNLHIRKELGFGQGFDRFVYVDLEDSDVVEAEVMKLAAEIKGRRVPSSSTSTSSIPTSLPARGGHRIGRLDPAFEGYATDLSRLKVESLTEDRIQREDPLLLPRLGNLYDSEIMAVDDSVGSDRCRPGTTPGGRSSP